MQEQEKEKIVKFVSWNVNGLTSCMRENNFIRYFNESDADFFCLQEIRTREYKS